MLFCRHWTFHRIFRTSSEPSYPPSQRETGYVWGFGTPHTTGTEVLVHCGGGSRRVLIRPIPHLAVESPLPQCPGRAPTLLWSKPLSRRYGEAPCCRSERGARYIRGCCVHVHKHTTSQSERVHYAASPLCPHGSST